MAGSKEATVPGVTVKDVNQQEFIRALAAFFQEAESPWMSGHHQDGQAKDLTNYSESCGMASIALHLYLWRCASRFYDQDLCGHQRSHITSSSFTGAPRVWPANSSEPWKG